MSWYFSWMETRVLMRLGVPIVLAQLAQIGMNFVDTVMAGRYGSGDLAGVAVAGSILTPITMFAVGLLLALPAMSSQLVGARRPDRAAHLLRQGMLLSMVMAVVIALLFSWVSGRLLSLGIGPELEPVARGYLQAMIPGLPGFLFFINLRSFLEGFGRTRPAMIVGVLCLLLNIPCNYVFIYGHLGVPAMGGVGCGVATAICYWFMALGMAVYLHLDKDLGRWSLVRRLPSGTGRTPGLVDLKLIGSVLRVGLPNAVAICVEVSLFNLTALLLAPLGKVVVAGNQITLNYSALVFCLPLSINMAAAIRVGRNLGAGSITKARMSAHTALTCGFIMSIMTMLITIFFRHDIAALYSEDAAVLAMAANLMFFCACYQVVDNLQSIACGSLRGFNDTSYISRVCVFSCGFVGLLCGFILGRTDLLVPAMGAQGFWIAYILSLALCAVFYLTRLRRLLRLDMETISSRLAS